MNVARISIWGEYVGAVAWDDATGIATFEYDPNFKNKDWELAPMKFSYLYWILLSIN